ncbi:MAG: hypothetical protein ABMA64_18940 [Myxococcota bacterium]
MNIYLIPYTGVRHWIVGLTLGAVGLLSWWVALLLQVEVLPYLHWTFGVGWSQSFDGLLYVGTLCASVSAASLVAEASLRRRAMRWRVFYTALGSGLAFLTLLLGWGVLLVILRLLSSADEVLLDPALVTLRYRVAVWLAAGFAAGFGPFVARRLHAWITARWNWGGRDGGTTTTSISWLEWGGRAFAHLGGGMVAGAFAAAAWHVPGYYDQLQGDLYVSAALAAFVFGALHGWLVWPIPDDLYAGWVRVLSYERYGLRIPVPHTDGSAAERFVGHFPRGLDLYLPAEVGAAELHVSFVKSADGRYSVRGLSIAPTVVKRFLERIDLRYDPRRPAPLETSLGMEDRVLLGDRGQTEVEFLMLPKEER